MKWLREKLKGWKTRIVSFVLLVLGVAETIDPEILIQMFGENSRGYVTIAFAVGFAILRQNTTTPAGQSDA